MIENAHPANSRDVIQIESVEPQGPRSVSVGFTPGPGPRMEVVTVMTPRWKFRVPSAFKGCP